jgi:hypothetical protein
MHFIVQGMSRSNLSDIITIRMVAMFATVNLQCVVMRDLRLQLRRS